MTLIFTRLDSKLVKVLIIFQKNSNFEMTFVFNLRLGFLGYHLLCDCGLCKALIVVLKYFTTRYSTTILTTTTFTN